MTTKITNFTGLKVIKKKTFKDKRGYFREILRENEIGKKFPFMVMSYSKHFLKIMMLYMQIVLHGILIIQNIY